MTKHNLKDAVYAAIETIAEAEKVTKATLALLSRDLLTYVVDTHDIDSVNRLLGVLGPANKRYATLFFKHFLPHEAEQDADAQFTRFGKLMNGEKKIAERLSRITEFLKVETNDIWTWTKENVTVDRKPDYVARFDSALKKALAGDEAKGVEPASPFELISHFMGQVDPAAIEKFLEVREGQMQEAALMQMKDAA